MTGGMKRTSLLTTGDVAEHCQVTHHTVVNWIHGGKLKASTTPGGHHRILARDFAAFLQEHDLPPLEEGPADRRKVLVVDDDPALVEVVVEFLGETGEYELAEASDGFDAGIQLTRFAPDLVILDLMMPHLDGFKVCRRIKSNRETEHVKILVLTGFASDENVRRALGCGADCCVAKPVRMADLRAKVDQLLARKRSQALAGP